MEIQGPYQQGPAEARSLTTNSDYTHDPNANCRSDVNSLSNSRRTGIFRLSSGLTLYGLACGRGLPEVLGRRSQWHELKRDDYEETGKSQALPPITPAENPHSASLLRSVSGPPVSQAKT